MLRPGSWPSRLAAVALLVIALLALHRFLVAPLLALYQADQAAIAQHEALLQRYRSLAAQQPALSERLAARRDELARLEGYLEGPSDALAAAQLQDLVKTIIEAAGGAIQSTLILPATALDDEPQVRRAGLSLRFSASIDSLAEALYGLETAQPFLFLDGLIVSDQSGRSYRPADVPLRDAPQLDVRLELFGYLRLAAA